MHQRLNAKSIIQAPDSTNHAILAASFPHGATRDDVVAQYADANLLLSKSGSMLMISRVSSALIPGLILIDRWASVFVDPKYLLADGGQIVAT